MKPFFRFFAQRHLLANIITIMIILLGLNALMRIKRDMFPDLDFGRMMITTRYLGAAPEDVELNVTNKIEQELKGVAGIERMTSVSMENISVIEVYLDPDAEDQEEIKTEIREAVNRVTDLPPGVTESPLVVDIKTSIIPIIEVGVTGDIPYGELRDIAKDLCEKIEDLKGVSRVDKFGYLAREIKIEVSPKAIKEFQIPLREIISAIQARNIRATAGSFESYTSERNLVTLAQFADPTEAGDVIVRSSFEGPLIRVKDLAVVKDAFESERVISRMNGKQAISFLVNKKENADIIRTVDALKDLIERESPRLPDGVEVLYSNDLSKYIRNRFNVVRTNGLIGLGMVLVLLSLFLSLRSAFWVAIGIPVALLGVTFLMPAFDAHLDIVTLGAMIMVIGIIVDDGIIIAENIQRYRETGLPPLEAAVEGVNEVFRPVLTTVLTTVVAFAPFFFVSGLVGKFVTVIPLVITLSLFISLGEATIALPAHLIMGLRSNSRQKKGTMGRGWFSHLRSPFEHALLRVLKFRYLFVGFSLLLLLGLLAYAGRSIKFELFPQTIADQFHILIELPTGSSLRATSDKVRELEHLIAELPEKEIESFVTRIGNQGQFASGENENWAIISVSLTPYSERQRTAQDIVEELRQESDKMEGFGKLVYYVAAGGPPVGRAITVRVVGSDDTLRTQLADSVESFLTGMEGVIDIDRDDKLGKDQVEIQIDYDKLSRLGLTVADVAQNIRASYDGEIVTSVRYGEEDVDFRLILDEEARRKPELVEEVLIPNRVGRLIPLRNVAHLSVGPGPSNYYHYNEKRAVTITADIVRGKVTSLEATQAVLEHFDLEKGWPGAKFIVGGEAEETQESMASLFRAFIFAVVGIYLLLVLLFGSLTQPLMVIVSIPFAIIGVLLAFMVHGLSLSFIGTLGLIGVTGVVVNDALVLVSHTNDLVRERKGESLVRLVAKGTADRLRPVILTTLTTVFGLMPLAYGFGGDDPFIAPMALALGWGLVFSTPLTLALVPCLYMIRHDVGNLPRRIRSRFTKNRKGTFAIGNTATPPRD